jgi:hypothetical protein
MADPPRHVLDSNMYSILPDGDDGDDDATGERNETKGDETDEAMEFVEESMPADDNGGSNRGSHDSHSGEAIITDGSRTSNNERSKETNALRKEAKLRKTNNSNAMASGATTGKRDTEDHYEEAMDMHYKEITRRTPVEAAAITGKKAIAQDSQTGQSANRASASAALWPATSTTRNAVAFDTTWRTTKNNAEATMRKTVPTASKKPQTASATARGRASFEPSKDKNNNKPSVVTVDSAEEDAATKKDTRANIQHTDER